MTATDGSTASDEVPAGGDFLEQVLPELLQFPGHRILSALLVIALGVWLSKFFVRLLGRPIAQRFARQSVAQTVLGAVRGLTIGFALIVAGSLIGLRIGDIVLSVTVFSAVVGIVLAPIVGNIINGIFVLADQPFEIGDMIELDDETRGFVDDITIRYTKIFTLDNTFLVIPNGNIRDRDVVNYSAEDERTRLTLDVLVTYESDISEARRLMEIAARDTDNVIKGGPDIRVGSGRYPANPAVLLASFGDNGILLRLRYWATKPYKIPTIESAVRTEIRRQFANSDATTVMAYPHQHLVFDETSGEANVALRNKSPADIPNELLGADIPVDAPHGDETTTVAEGSETEQRDVEDRATSAERATGGERATEIEARSTGDSDEDEATSTDE